MLPTTPKPPSSVLNYWSCVLTGLPPLVFLLLGLFFVQHPMILLNYLSDQATPLLKTFQWHPHLTLSPNQNLYNRQQDPPPNPSASSLNPYPVALPTFHFTSTTLVSNLFV